MRSAWVSGKSSRRTQLRTALAMSSTEPASVPSSVVQRPSRTSTGFPDSMKRGLVPPTGGIASVTSMALPAPRNASRSIAGATCTPSTISPKKAP